MEKIGYDTLGPFGGQGGDPWNDGIYTGVKQLVIYFGSVIDSIQIEYDQNGQSKWSEKHGKSGGGVKNLVKLDYPDEFLISISGYSTTESSNAVVRSLKIQSNRKQYGPYGKEEGTYFSASPNGRKIIGFHGRSGLYLDSLGAYFKPIHLISIGPFGGLGGHNWDDGIYTTIRQLKINHGSVVDSIQIEYDKNGCSKWSEKRGESEGGTESVVKLDYPNEFIISFSGFCTEESSKAVVRSLAFQTNKQLYGPYGKEQGTPFTSSSTYGKIIGFHGRCGLYLDSIGAYFEAFPMSSKPISIGPFGGLGGHDWDDGTYTTIRQLKINHGSVVDSIQIEYDKNGCSKWSEKHGESEGGTESVVKLNYPNEFLISFSGYCTEESNKAVVRSLAFQTNKQLYGPYGKEQGTPFTSSTTYAKIIGFHGRCGLYLDSIGAYFEAFPMLSRAISIGPFGGLGGHEWDDGIYTTIRQLIIHHGSVVDSIQIEYDKNGCSKWSERRGESEGGTESVVKLDYPNEFLISFSGYCTEESNKAVVRSLAFQTNKQLYGPYGKEQGTPFTSSTTNGKIIGFHGRCGLYLDSIGAYFEALPISSQPISIGPFGGLGGSQWDDGIYTTIKQLIIASGSVIDSIQIEYDKNGCSKWSVKHGKSEGGTKSVVKLDYPSEFLVSISGYCGKVCEVFVVRSLKIESNKRTYGPFGVEEGEYFKFPSTSGKIIGFHGRSGDYLDSIGAYVKTFPSP